MGGDHRPGDPGQVPASAPAIESDWTPGSRYALVHPGADGPLAEGENLVVEPPRRLVQTMHTMWGEDAEREGTSRVTWEIEPVGDSCRLTVTHDQLRDGAPPELYGGWPMILSGLKTWLETGADPHHPGLADVRRALTDQERSHALGHDRRRSTRRSPRRSRRARARAAGPTS